MIINKETHKLLFDYNESCIEKPWSIVLVSYRIAPLEGVDVSKLSEIKNSGSPKDHPLAIEIPGDDLKFFSEHGASIGDIFEDGINYSIFLTQNININFQGVKGGQTAEIEFSYEDFPINPQHFMVGNVYIFGGALVEDKILDPTKIDGDNLKSGFVEIEKNGKYEIARFWTLLNETTFDGESLLNNSLLFSGYIDTIEGSFGSDGFSSTITARDHIGLLLDKQITKTAFKGLGKIIDDKPIEQVVKKIMDLSDCCAGQYVHAIGFEADKIFIPKSEIRLEKKESPKARIHPDMSYWDLIFEVCSEVGLNAEIYYATRNKNSAWDSYVCEPRLKISTPEVNFGFAETADSLNAIKNRYTNKEFYYNDKKEDVKNSWFEKYAVRPVCYIGYDASTATIKHEMNSVAPVVNVVTTDKNGKRIEASYPVDIKINNPDGSTEYLNKDAYQKEVKNARMLGVKGWNPKEYVEIIVPGLQTADKCKEVAERILNSMKLGQYSMSLETNRLYFENADESNQLVEINSLIPGHAIDILFTAPPKSFIDEVIKEDRQNGLEKYRVFNFGDNVPEYINGQKTWFIVSMSINMSDSGCSRTFELINAWNI
jgi:hypothetical protein